MAAIFTRFNRDEGVGDFVKDGIEDFLFRVVCAKGATNRNFFSRGATDSEAADRAVE